MKKKTKNLMIDFKILKNPVYINILFLLGDVCAESLVVVLDSYTCTQCKLDVIRYGVSPVTEGDIKLAEPFRTIIYALNDGTTDPNVNQLLSKSAASVVRPREHKAIYLIFVDFRA